jgi:hypothetical protein
MSKALSAISLGGLPSAPIKLSKLSLCFGLVALVAGVHVLGGCHPLPRRGPREQPTSRPARPWPKFPMAPGRATLGRYALACYRAGLGQHPEVFARGGQIVIRWHADRKGDLLRLEFVSDSFGSWEVNARDESMAQCIVRRARGAKLRWSREGWAPLRLRPHAGAATSSASRPTSRPLVPTSRPTPAATRPAGPQR